MGQAGGGGGEVWGEEEKEERKREQAIWMNKSNQNDKLAWP
jgi:hypothetical protein